MKEKSPLYLTIAQTIKQDILNGVYPVGSLIPTEVELEQQFEVSKITVRRAIEILESEGYVLKKSGRGTTVISNRLFNKLSKAASFSSLIDLEGGHLEKEIQTIERLKTEDGTEISEAFGEEVLKIVRMYRLNSHPYIVFEHYVPVEMLHSIDDFKPGNLSLYKWLASADKEVSRFRDAFLVVPADQAHQRLLDTQETHLLKRIRKSFNEKNQCIELSYAFYDTKKYPYMIEYEV